MGLYYGLNNNNNLIQFGNRGDTCTLCVREKATQDRIDLVTARNRLQGELEGKKAVKIRQSGMDIAICLEHIHEIAEKFPVDEEVGTVPTEEEVEVTNDEE